MKATRILAATLSLFVVTDPATALDTVAVEAACAVPNLARPLRQTLVVIDQGGVQTQNSADVGEINRRWINRVLAIAGVQDGQTAKILAPRERITVFMARQDGSDLVRIFTGCAPSYSQDEILELKRNESKFDTFFGRNVENKIESDRKSFRAKLTSALAEVTKADRPKRGNDDASGLIQTLPLLSRAFDLGQGIPRVILISSMNLPSVRSAQSQKAARESGFQLAEQIGADLQRSEVYVTGMTAEAGKHVRDFLQSFFLGAKGRLISASGDALPQTTEAPRTVQVFSGSIDYAGVRVPMQLRLAVDNTGALVNSWVEVTVRRPVATPLTGKVVCKGDNFENCDVTGDGKDFAQIWAIDVGSEPKFDPALPFSGVRHIEFSTSPRGLNGKVFDPLVVINGKKELPFDLARTSSVRF